MLAGKGMLMVHFFLQWIPTGPTLSRAGRNRPHHWLWLGATAWAGNHYCQCWPGRGWWWYSSFVSEYLQVLLSAGQAGITLTSDCDQVQLHGQEIISANVGWEGGGDGTLLFPQWIPTGPTLSRPGRNHPHHWLWPGAITVAGNYFCQYWLGRGWWWYTAFFSEYLQVLLSAGQEGITLTTYCD
jgi:hypothetical protein